MKFELWKIYAKKVNFLFPIMLIAFLLIPLLVQLLTSQSTRDQEYKEYLQSQQLSAEANLALYQQNDGNENAINRYQTRLEHMQAQYMALLDEDMEKERIEKEWVETNILEEMVEGGLDEAINQQKLLVATLHYFNTHDATYYPNNRVQKLPFVNVLLLMANMLPMVVFLFICGLFAANFASAEFTDHTEVFLETVPQKIAKLFLQKFLLHLSMIFASLIIGLLLVFIGSVPIGGLGSWRYPVLYLDQDLAVHTFTAGNYLAKVGVSLIVGIFLFVLVAEAGAYFGRSFLVSFGAVAGVTLFSFMSTYLPQNLGRFLATTYLDTPNLLLQKTPWGTLSLSWKLGIGLQIAMCLLLFFGLLGYFHKKN